MTADRQTTAPAKTTGGARSIKEPERSTLSLWSLLLAGGMLLALLFGQWVILVAILGLALLITVHEFGHFIAAKAFGMRVEKFYVGFPPAALRKTWGETEYGVGIIPLGGFCKISGMTPDEPVSEKAVAELLERAQNGRIEGTYTVAEVDAAIKSQKTRIKQILADGAAGDDEEVLSRRRLQGVLEGYRAEILAPGGQGDPVYYEKPVWQRNITIAAGPLMNFAAAVVIMILFVGIQGINSASMTLDEVVPGTPAAKAGITAGATIIGADGERWTEWEQASGYFSARPDETISLTYRPAPVNGQAQPPQTVDVTLAENPDLPGSGYLGVRAGIVTERPAPWEAVWLGVTGTKDIFVGTFTGFWWLISGKISATGPNGAVGPVGIVDVSRQAVEQSWYPILLAFLSVNLGIINLLPILPFDGGHIAVNLLERVRGRRLDTRVLERVVAFGTVLLVMLFIFLTFNDIKRFF